MKALTWAVRVEFAEAGIAFLRRGGVRGGGPIVTFYSKAQAESEATALRGRLHVNDKVTVIERSHGRNTSPRAEKGS